MLRSNQISLYVDALIIEAIVSEPSIVKQADSESVIMSLMGTIKDYFERKIDPNNKVESILDALAPGAISAVFSLFGKTWLGLLFGLAMNVFDIKIGSIVTSLYNSIKSLVLGKQQITSQDVDSVVESSIKENTSPVTDEVGAKKLEDLQKKKLAEVCDVKKRLRDARFVKLALIDYAEQKNFNKFAGWASGFQSKIAGILKSLFGLIFKIALRSAGIIVAGDAIKSFVGKPSTTYSKPSAYVSKQTKFKQNSSYNHAEYNKGDATWAEGFTNNFNGISDMLVKFTKEVYDGVLGLEELIKSTETFQELVRIIESFNSSAAGSNIVFIPRGYTNKKQLVDLFIDDVAEKAPKPMA